MAINKERFIEEGAGEFKDKVMEFSKDEKLFGDKDGKSRAIFTAGFVRGIIWMTKTFPQISKLDPKYKDKIVSKLLNLRKE